VEHPESEEDLRIGPVGLVAGDTVASVIHLQKEARRASEIDLVSLGLHPFAQHGRPEAFLVADAHHENDTAASTAGLIHVVPKPQPKLPLAPAAEEHKPEAPAQAPLILRWRFRLFASAFPVIVCILDRDRSGA